MRRLTLPFLAAAAVATALSVSPVRAADTITVGMAGPITGDLAEFGQQLVRGAEMAVADINKAGGVLGKQLKLEKGDDQCDEKQAPIVANDLVAKGVVFVDGHFCSGSSIPASNIYTDEGILQITPASTNPKFTDQAPGKLSFRTCGRDDQQGVFDGTWLAEHYKGKRVAIVHDKTPYGQGLADLTKDAMNKAGLKEAAYEAITRGEQDYTALVTKLKDAKVDVIFFGGYHPEAALIVKQAREQGLQAPLMSGDSLNTLEFATLAGKASEGVMFSNAAESRNLPTAQKVVAEFRQAGYEPEGYTLSTYAALEVWAKAVAEAGTTDSAKVAETLRSHQWDTVIGKIGFDAKGDLTASTYTWYVFKDGKYSEAGSM